MKDNLDSDIWDRDYPTEEEVYEEPTDLYEDEVQEEVYEDDDFLDDFLEEDFEEEQSLMDNARIRLEQGRLYEMLIKHSLFDGVDALPEAISNVEKEMKDFIMERLEILLGMKSEKQVEVQRVESPFNDMEVDALRMVASKITKGASATGAQRQWAPENEEETEPSPLAPVKKKVRSQGLNTLGGNKKPAPKQKSARKKPQTKKIAKKPVRKIRKDLADTSTKGLGVDEIAKKDMKYLESLKNMPLEQKAEIVNQRHSKSKAKSQLAGAGSEQAAQDRINSQYETRAANDGNAGNWMAMLKKAGKLD
jgi:hypothetical protein